MSKLQAQDIKKVAGLIKLNLTDQEIQRYEDQLNTVMPSVDVLQELNTDNVKETSQTHGLENVVAEDVAEEGLDINKYPNKANLKNNYFVVHRVIK